MERRVEYYARCDICFSIVIVFFPRYQSMFYKSTFYKSMFYKSSPCFTNPIQSIFYNMPGQQPRPQGSLSSSLKKERERSPGQG